MAKPNEDITVHPDWSGQESIAPRAVNVAMVQTDPDFHVLTLGFMSPPRDMHLMDEDEITVPVAVVARVAMVPSDVDRLIRMLLASRETHNRILEAMSKSG